MRRGNGGIIGTVNAPVLNANKGVWSLFEQQNAERSGDWVLTVASLFSAGENGVWYDPSDLSTVWADTAGTTPASVDGTVARIDDKSGNGNHAIQATSSAQPILRQSGGLTYLEFDGVDDGMETTAAVDLSGQSFVSTFVGFEDKKAGRTASQVLLGTANTIAQGNALEIFKNVVVSSIMRDFGVLQSVTSSTSTWNIGYNTSDFTSPQTAVIFVVNDFTTTGGSDAISARVNGTTLPLTPNFQASTTSNAPNQVFHIGKRGNNSNFLEGNLHGLIVRGASSDASEIENTEIYLASKTGVTL